MPEGGGTEDPVPQDDGELTEVGIPGTDPEPPVEEGEYIPPPPPAPEPQVPPEPEPPVELPG